MNFNNDEEVLEFFDRLLERLHQAGYDHPGSHYQLVYVAPGAQYVSHIGTQIFGSDQPQKQRQGCQPSSVKSFGDDTPLSALFRKVHHDELRKVIESWRPYLIGDDTTVDALAIAHFEFDKKRIYSNRVYYDLLDLDALGALQVSLSQLACYLADHSNLSSSQATLYRQLKMYRLERT